MTYKLITPTNELRAKLYKCLKAAGKLQEWLKDNGKFPPYWCYMFINTDGSEYDPEDKGYDISHMPHESTSTPSDEYFMQHPFTFIGVQKFLDQEEHLHEAIIDDQRYELQQEQYDRIMEALEPREGE